MQKQRRAGCQLPLTFFFIPKISTIMKNGSISCAGAFARDQFLLPAPLQKEKNFNTKKIALRLYEIIYKKEMMQDT
jgi:hypothetical protein